MQISRVIDTQGRSTYYVTYRDGHTYRAFRTHDMDAALVIARRQILRIDA